MYEYAAIFKIISTSEIKAGILGPSGMSRRVPWYSHPVVSKESNGFKVWRERKPTICKNQMFIINFCPNMFRASLWPSSGEQRPCVTAYGVLLASYNAAPHNRYQPQPAELEQYTKCSNTVFDLLNMGIIMPETYVETEINNKHLIVASCWFFLSLHTFDHDARSQEPEVSNSISIPYYLFCNLNFCRNNNTFQFSIAVFANSDSSATGSTNQRTEISTG